MLDPRIYRAALLPVVLAVLVVAFSLADRARPIGTTLPPDAFRGAVAFQTLNALAGEFPDRRPGSVSDGRLAGEVERLLRERLGSSGIVRRDTFTGHTLDGERDLVNVVATRPGGAGSQLVVVAHRDAARTGAAAELSGTAALLELASVAADGRFHRTVTFVSTTGGSGGLSGAVHAAQRLSGPVDAVLVLGDLASRRVRKPQVVPWVAGGGMAPLQLRRTVELAVRTETGSDAGGPRAVTQFVREVFGLAPTEQGVFGRDGRAAVLLSASGERGPGPRAAVAPQRLTAFGRAALRALTALDNGPSIGRGPSSYLVTRRKVIPGWAISLLAGALLLPVWLATVDGFARARRRRAPIGRWVTWVLATALPFALTSGVAVALGLAGLIDPAPHAPLRPGTVSADGASAVALGVLAVVLALGFLVVRPLAVRVAGPSRRMAEDGAGPAAGVALVVSGLTLVTWVLNPFAALLLVPAAHAWLFAVAPEAQVGRAARVVLVLIGLVAPAAAALVLADVLGASLPQALWLTVVGVAGGAVGPLAWLAWSLLAGGAVAALLVALRTGDAERPDPAGITSRGPMTYAGPGSLGGTESALR